jgi:hypothetical protein
MLEWEQNVENSIRSCLYTYTQPNLTYIQAYYGTA